MRPRRGGDGGVLARGAECHGLHREACRLLEAEEEVHGVDGVARGAFEEVVDDGGDEQASVDLVEVDDALVRIHHIFEIGNLRGYEGEVVVVVVLLVDLDYL